MYQYCILVISPIHGYRIMNETNSLFDTKRNEYSEAYRKKAMVLVQVIRGFDLPLATMTGTVHAVFYFSFVYVLYINV